MMVSSSRGLVRFRRLWCAWIAMAFASGCGTPAATDVPIPDAHDASGDGDVDPPCTTDLQCTDNVFCNGAERCMPAAPDADRRGCVPATMPPCAASERCDEASTRCISSCADNDSDGHGAASCGGDDCDDNDSRRFPGNPEVCDAAGHDEDCDPCTVASNGSDGDGDHDTAVSDSCFNTYAGPTPTCDAVLARVDGGAHRVTGVDCDDTNPNVRPNQTEACNGIDDNCNGTIDEAGLMHPDVDNDGRGDPTVTTMHACATGWVSNGDDCDDTRAETYGGPLPAREQCDGRDNDCSLPGAMAGGLEAGEDDDADGHSPPAAACLARGEVGAVGSAFPKDDCNDSMAGIHPGTPEVCGDGVDQDCNGIIDDPVQSICTDADGDGHGDPATRRVIMSCAIPSGSVPGAVCDDCNDARAAAFPGNREFCDRVDNDCSSGGGVATDEDVDGDGHAASSATCAGLGEAGAPSTALPRNDCNDGDPARYPGAIEICDLQDFDCSSGGATATDEDADGDGHAPSAAACVGFGEPGGSTALPRDDCDDSRASIHGGLAAAADTSTCDGIDNDCDPSTSELTVPCSTGGYCAPGATCGRALAVLQISSGGGHTCARLGNGTVRCMGDNRFGQLGDGTTTIRSEPALVPALAGVVEVSAGGNHTCARLNDGSVRCWGDNRAGQLGDGSTTNRLGPTVVPGLTGVVELSAGGDHTCARLRDGSIRCWGANASGQLGDGTLANRPSPTLVPSVAGAAELDAGTDHTCARFGDGTMRCWGSNAFGQLGDGSTSNRATPTPIAGLAAVASMSAGGHHTCARLDDGSVRCWGENASGQLGDGTVSMRMTPTMVPGLIAIAEVSAGGRHTCARSATGTLRCWGDNFYGQIGDGSTANRPIPTPVLGLAGIAEVSAGGNHTCVLDGTGVMSCWGRIGDGAYSRSSAAAGPGLVGVAQVSAGGNHTCARLGDATVRCWGDNSSGQIGDGTAVTRPSPAIVPGLGGVAEVRAGGHHTCARGTDGSVRCWGDNTYGQLGDGTTANRSTPTIVPGLAGVVEITAGRDHTCARLSDATIFCWGNNASGQLGDGTTTNRTAPTLVAALVGLPVSVVQLRAGGSHTCTAMSDGTARCWGNNASGQLGSNSTVSRSYPGTVSPGGAPSTIREVTAGGDHTCGVNSGALRCWGANGSGQVGDGTTSNRLIPTTVTIPWVTLFAAGGNHTCAYAQRDVYCWGENGAGQLGDGTTTNRALPANVPSLSGVAELSAGFGHTCARLDDATIRCWGDNLLGQLGDLDTSTRTTPHAVAIGISEVRAGDSHTCARFDDSVFCWGANASGQLGDGSTTNRQDPTPVPSLASVVGVSTGLAHTCAVLHDGTLRCWGANGDGQIGDRTTIGRASPTTVMTTSGSTLGGVSEVVSGARHNCARLSDGTVSCWGDDQWGQLGTTGPTDRTGAISIFGVTSVEQLTAGVGHTCALVAGGTVSCWGDDTNGQLGDGRTTARSTPATIPGLAGVAEVRAGDTHTCARMMDGTVRCWGGNASGQLGDGSTTNRSSPTVVPGLASVVVLAAGGSQTCAGLADGTVRCWGRNESGQLGDGTTVDRASPSTVTGLVGTRALAAGGHHACALDANAVRCWGRNDSGQIGDGTTSMQLTASTVWMF
jgi:alpha-tubulin suppressor-like RCC1 family protein